MIVKHITWDILDPSKIQEYMTCPRKYFYRYILGWEKDEPNIHLVFGEAWHRAMEVLLLEGYTPEAVHKAFHKFKIYFDSNYAGVENPKKNPENALNALIDYIKEHKNDSFDVLFTEVSGTVPIAKDRVIHFRMDDICKDDKGYFSLEHKTGSQASAAWMSQWHLKMQTLTYAHVLYCMYTPDEVWGIRINGTIFRTRDCEFLRVPARVSRDIMRAWVMEVNHYVDMIEGDTKIVQTDCHEDDDILICFVKNSEACTMYNTTCAFHDFCLSWANPLKHAEKPPIGFCRRWWDPREREEKAKKIVHLEKEEE